MANPRENLQQRQSRIPAVASAAALVVGRPKEDTVQADDHPFQYGGTCMHACEGSITHEDHRMMRDVLEVRVPHTVCHY